MLLSEKKKNDRFDDNTLPRTIQLFPYFCLRYLVMSFISFDIGSERFGYLGLVGFVYSRVSVSSTCRDFFFIIE